MNPRERFLTACACGALERPPVWIMRQAGRYLPEYRELKAKHGFLKMVRTPELAVEISLQPVRRFAFDAAILFSDILVVPEALGLGYTFRDEGGIAMEGRIEGRAGVEALGPANLVPEKLSYVGDALSLLRKEVAGTRAVLGFGGSPWTLATYMVEGGSSQDFARVKALFHGDRPTFDLLLGKLTAALVEYFKMQIRCGTDAIQIFDSWGGVVAGPDYEAASLRWIRAIVAALPVGFPIILYGKGTGANMLDQASSGARVLSLDASIHLAAARRSLPANVAVQGNLDPAIMNTTPGEVRREALKLLESMRGLKGHVFNLGHGILPQAKIECVEALVDAVTAFK